MSTSINFRITAAGIAGLFNATNTGVAMTLTHVQIGKGNKIPAGTETGLLDPMQTAAFASGSKVNNNQIRMSALFPGVANFQISEVGLWAGSPGSAGAVLVGYWSQSTGVLAYQTTGVDFVFSHDMLISTSIPAGSLTILADESQSAMLSIMGQHNGLADPHPQYATGAQLTAHLNAPDPHPQYATDEQLMGVMTAHLTAPDPHPQYMTAAEVNARLLGTRGLRFFHSGF